MTIIVNGSGITLTRGSGGFWWCRLTSTRIIVVDGSGIILTRGSRG